MENADILKELLVIAFFGVAIAVLFSRFKLPLVAGLLFAGALVGPYGLKLIHQIKHIEGLAEIGVGLLLFSIGLEFSLKRLIRVLQMSLIGGLIQVGLTIVGAAIVSLSVGQTLSQGVFYGFVISLSSTAIVMSFLSSRRELDAPHGRFIVGILIFQDLCVIPMMLLVPFLAGKYKGELLTELSRSLGTAIFVVVLTVMLSRKLLPRIFHWVDSTKMREIFLLAVLCVFIGISSFTASQGLSFALGAFLAGVVLAESDFGHRALSDVLPLRSTFTSIFFISLGMLFDVRIILEHPHEVILLTVAFIFGKGLLCSLAATIMGFPSRVAWLSGVGLAQFGEFGFVLAKLGQKAGLVSSYEVQLLLAAGIITMFITPLAMSFAPHITAAHKILQPIEKLLGNRSFIDASTNPGILTNHVVVAGYGMGGKLLVESLKQVSIPYVILELNAESVKQARDVGEPIFYGDISSPESMLHIGIERARAIVLLINDPIASRRGVAAIHRFAPQVPIFLRARYFSDQESLQIMGAKEVVFEEIEASKELSIRLLRFLETSPENIETLKT